MEDVLKEFFSELHWFWLAGTLVACLAVLGKGADWLVMEAVALSTRSGMPKSVIGATVVSLGTTSPEAAVSVLAALEGQPGIALGNAVGSVTCDTGLILGIACFVAPLPLDHTIVNRQGRLQLGAGLLLVVACIAGAADPARIFQDGGYLTQNTGFVFLGLLFLYLWVSARWARQARQAATVEDTEGPTASIPGIVAKLLGSLILVVGASWVLIPAVKATAERCGIPESVIAFTMVAFGTSLPELVTAVTAARRGHGELAVGNVIGADILNVLFVAGAAAAATPNGLETEVHFFTLLFPGMLIVLVVFRTGILVGDKHLSRPFGALLVASWVIVTVLALAFRPQ